MQDSTPSLENTLWRATIPSLTHTFSMIDIQSQMGIKFDELNCGEKGKFLNYPVVTCVKEPLVDNFSLTLVSKVTPSRRGNVYDVELGESPPLFGDVMMCGMGATELKTKQVWGWKKRKRKGLRNIMKSCLGRGYQCGRGRGRQKNGT